MHNKHLIHLMAKIMNELAHKSPLINYDFIIFISVYLYSFLYILLLFIL